MLSKTMLNSLQFLVLPLVRECQQRLASFTFNFTDDVFCNGTADDFGGCFNFTKAGRVEKIQCPFFFNKKGFVYKVCSREGKWLKSDYHECRQQNYEEVTAMYPVYVFIGGYLVSIVLLAISLFIFLYFPQLQCGRVTVHKNLFLSYILTGISWISYFVLVTFNGEVLLRNPSWCQILHVFTYFFMLCNYFWMFCEGLYLHTILLRVFSTGRKLIAACHVTGWGFPLIPTAVYAFVRSSDSSKNTKCWNPYAEYLWIIYGPIIGSLLLNVIFLINIVRLLMTKLKRVPEAAQTKKAAKATLVLIPLLGLHNLLLPVRPEDDSPMAEVYTFLIAISLSLQGSFVAIIYCFCNGEVTTILKRKWKQHLLMRGTCIKIGNSHITTYSVTENGQMEVVSEEINEVRKCHPAQI
ncbi:calcitonin gene-related peptide type 1 receptor-like [Crassostrea angulata]|uniref:calcitonin gene-related peptide type 1 receptor-like n=1 Tax=Magallana angulata TaxID=2784310 RepID=UPI0022B1FC8F|nr:calcitonin gene-related peptide type 1 receptor-like [Crassostrea angulata]